jgi:ZIP family zinc transporter
VGVLALLVQSLAQLAGDDAAPGLRFAMLGGAAGFATTALGALPALVLRGLPQRVEDSLLGLAAGMMLAASAFRCSCPGWKPREKRSAASRPAPAWS